jgi:hypothetical protein
VIDMHEDQPARLPAADETWCHWHRGYTDTGRLINVEEQGSGPGGHVYACAPCRTKHRLTLWASRPAPETDRPAR